MSARACVCGPVCPISAVNGASGDVFSNGDTHLRGPCLVSLGTGLTEPVGPRASRLPAALMASGGEASLNPLGDGKRK